MNERAKIRSWGNSNGILISKFILELLHWKTNDLLDITVEEKEEQLVIKKRLNPSHPKNIEELFANYDGEYEFGEIDWGEPAGSEIW